MTGLTDSYQSRRTPHGVRGLKFDGQDKDGNTVGVAPLTGCVD